jgi:hypothetical protein
VREGARRQPRGCGPWACSWFMPLRLHVGKSDPGQAPRPDLSRTRS